MQSQELPLISVVVLTYNSSQYVLETLDSIYRQTYQGPIELIVTDDCSIDNTVDVCKKWIKSNSERFKRIGLIETKENTGVSKNINRGCKWAQGVWIKPIAGDDVLMDECIDILYNAAMMYGDSCSFLAASMYCFERKEQLDNISRLLPWNFVSSNMTIDLDYAFYNPMFYLAAPSFFLSKMMLDSIGYYPEIARNIEDAPLVRKVLSEGYMIHVIGKPVVFYRNHPQSLTNTYLSAINTSKCVIKSYDLYLRSCFTFSQRWDTFFRLLPIRVNILLKGKIPLLATLLFWGERLFRLTFYKKIVSKLHKNSL